MIPQPALRAKGFKTLVEIHQKFFFCDLSPNLKLRAQRSPPKTVSTFASTPTPSWVLWEKEISLTNILSSSARGVLQRHSALQFSKSDHLNDGSSSFLLSSAALFLASHRSRIHLGIRFSRRNISRRTTASRFAFPTCPRNSIYRQILRPGR